MTPLIHLWQICPPWADPPFADPAASPLPVLHQAVRSYPEKMPESSPEQHWGRLPCQAERQQREAAEETGLPRVVWERMPHRGPHGRPVGGCVGFGPRWPSCLGCQGLLGWACGPVLHRRHPAHRRRTFSSLSMACLGVDGASMWSLLLLVCLRFSGHPLQSHPLSQFLACQNCKDSHVTPRYLHTFQTTCIVASQRLKVKVKRQNGE